MKRLYVLLTLLLVSCASLKGNCELFGEIEYLFWNFSQRNMPYAVAIQDLSNFANFEEIQQEDHWASGFRIALSVGVGGACNTKFSWTRFHNQFRDSESDHILLATELLAPNNLPTFLGGDGVGGPAVSKWHINFDMWDWDVGTSLFFKDVICLYPHVGLKGGIIRQSQLITYKNFLNPNDGNDITASMNEKNSFYSVGPKCGLECSFFLPAKWSLDGKLAAALLCGKQISRSMTTIVEPAISFTFGSNFLMDHWGVLPTLQTYLGISRYFSVNHFPMTFAIGYEAQVFFDLWRTQNSIVQQIFITDAGYAALMLQGLTAKLEAYF